MMRPPLPEGMAAASARPSVDAAAAAGGDRRLRARVRGLAWTPPLLPKGMAGASSAERGPAGRKRERGLRRARVRAPPSPSFLG